MELHDYGRDGLLVDSIFVQAVAPGVRANRQDEHALLNPVLLRSVLQILDRSGHPEVSDGQEELQRVRVRRQILTFSVKFLTDLSNLPAILAEVTDRARARDLHIHSRFWVLCTPFGPNLSKTRKNAQNFLIICHIIPNYSTTIYAWMYSLGIKFVIREKFSRKILAMT